MDRDPLDDPVDGAAREGVVGGAAAPDRRAQREQLGEGDEGDAAQPVVETVELREGEVQRRTVRPADVHDLRGAVTTEFGDDVGVVVGGVGVGGGVHDDEGAVVDHRLRAVAEPERGVVETRDSPRRQFEQLQRGLLGEALQRAGAEVHDAFGVGVQQGLDLPAPFDQRRRGGAQGLDVSGLVGPEHQERGEQHRGEARRHGEAGVVGLFRHHQHERVRRTAVLPGQGPLGVAGDDEVVRPRGEVVHDPGRRDALGAVPGPREGHQQDGAALRQQAEGVGDEVGRGEGVDPAAQVAAQRRARDVTGEGGGPRAGEDDAQVVLRQDRGEEVVQRVPVPGEQGDQVAPRARLLPDLVVGRGPARGSGDVGVHGRYLRSVVRVVVASVRTGLSPSGRRGSSSRRTASGRTGRTGSAAGWRRRSPP